MTEKTTKAKAEKTATNVVSDAFAPVTRMFEAVKNAPATTEIPAQVREFVVRNVDAAKEGVATAETGAVNAAATVEKAYVAVAGVGAKVSRGLIGATVANVTMTLEAAKSVAEAPTVAEAGQRYVAFLRDYTQANLGHAQSAMTFVRETATEGAEAVKVEMQKFMPGSKAA